MPCSNAGILVHVIKHDSDKPVTEFQALYEIEMESTVWIHYFMLRAHELKPP